VQYYWVVQDLPFWTETLVSGVRPCVPEELVVYIWEPFAQEQVVITIHIEARQVLVRYA